MPKEKKLTIESSMGDFKRAYEAKRRLLERQLEDHRFSLGEQWSEDDKSKLEAAGFKPFVDNRIQPNLFLLTGLERQNRTDFKAFPEGEEDGLKADIASALFKDAIKRSGFSYKSSEQFKDGITCGESHLELYLDFTDSMINGKPCWRKADSNTVFPEPNFREYDFSDARYVYKLTSDISREDLINLYPEKKRAIEKASSGKLDIEALLGAEGRTVQHKDYRKTGGSSAEPEGEGCFDLIERFYKKYVEKVFVGDKKTGEVREAESAEKAEAFVEEYKAGIERDQAAYAAAVEQAVAAAGQQLGGMVQDPISGEMAPAYDPEVVRAELENEKQLPPPPPSQDPERFIVIKRMVPEIWCFANAPGIDEPLADERAWSYPKWKSYPFVPYFARFSTAPLTGEDRHLLVQGVVHQVKGAQERHNKSEMLMLRHLNSSANSGWISVEGAWVNPDEVKKLGTMPGVNLEYRADKEKPERIGPGQLSQGHAQLSADSAEAIKAQLGINADLLASQQGGSDSGRAIALRQRQGLLMVQELFDNLTRSRQIAGRMLLTQLGEMYDTETAMKVLGEAFLSKNFPPLMLPDPENPEAEPQPMPDPETGKPMLFDRGMAEVAIAEVLAGELGTYDVSVGEAVASETQRMANAAELGELASKMPIPPEVLVRHSQLPEATKNEILTAIKQAQALTANTPAPTPAKPKDAAA